MEKAAIPRLALEAFTQEHFKVPFLNVEQYPVNASLFTIKDRKHTPVNDYISPNRRQFYKIFHITSGTGILTVGLHQYHTNPGDISFLHPDEIMSWQNTSTDTEGHFCLIHPRYFEQQAHLLQLFKQYPYFQPSKAVVQLTAATSATIHQLFQNILAEEESHHDDKKQAILLHLQMILLEAQRAGKNLPDVAVPESYRYIHGFLSLLESTFQVQSPNDIVKVKTAQEFADQLHVHPNYLNALVKNQTGKTLRVHIQDRLLYEAKVLLTQTDWDIRNISYVLGFSEQAAFTAFFHKKEQMPPSVFREKHALQAHL
ncbi:AraC-like ligand binding domain-containing protein [Filimonas lacunae]|uniref:AraC-like ligand binding domain-containing protein n=1 Tax=Filimonas lacunae TaxID=477680 RepID=A0A173MBA5_9BACT|nr:AraC family transcriptional regulator [Filimonas lacunae]BAV04844.1 transcriptional regulator, AraC family [Filimonas lacunae]SIT34676.1 AraC-like ligand binding domain-containing protein [Filimonas lacunae]